jgi:small subunit ribosomal protein S10
MGSFGIKPNYPLLFLELIMSSLIRIRMKAYDHKILDKEVSKIADVVRRTNATVRSPFPLPTKIKKWTVLRGPHVNKST